jgi:hypothetical protein
MCVVRARDRRPPTLLFELDSQPYLIDHTKIQNISSPAPEGMLCFLPATALESTRCSRERRLQ